MITVMRRYRRALQVGLLVVIVAFVVTSVYVGARSGGPDRSDAVATVNGEDIPLERYQRRYQAYLDAYSRVYRDRFSPALAEQLGLPQQTVNDLVQEALVVQRARTEGLEVADEELNAAIQAVPSFQDNGRFSLRLYQEFLRRRGTGAAAFEADVRRELTRMKVENAVKGGVKVSDAELEQAFLTRREEVRAAWALVDTAPLVTAATVSEAEVEGYLKERSAEFQQPERRRVQYVTLSPKDFRPPVSDAAVEKYYTEHAEEFRTPHEVRASHLLVTVPPTGGSAAEDKAKSKVVDAIRRVKAGEDFAKIAAQISEDPGSKAKGGDLGWVKRGEMVPPFEQAVFELKKGEVTAEPVRTQFGFHAIKVFDVREEGRQPLKEAAPAIRDRLAAEAAEAAARARAEEVRGPLQSAKDFMEEARRRQLSPVETTMARVQRPAVVGGPDPLEEAAFALSLGGVTAPVKTPAGFVVLKAIESLAAGVPPLAEIRDKVVAAVKRQKADAVAAERARQLADEAKSGDLLALAKKNSLAAGETTRFSRAKPAERLPGDAQLAALQTRSGEVASPVKTPQGYYVVKVLERAAPSIADLGTEREALSREVLAQKQSQAWESWLAGARAGAKIEMPTGPVAPRGPRRSG